MPRPDPAAPGAAAEDGGSDPDRRFAPAAAPPVRASLVGQRSLCTAGIAAAMAHSRFALVLQCESFEEFQAAAPPMKPSLCLYVAQARTTQQAMVQIAELRRSVPSLRILALSSNHADRNAFVSAGADWHLSSDISPEGFLVTLGSMMDLPSWIGPGIDPAESTGTSAASWTGASEKLSVREIEVIAVIARGKSNKGVARELAIAEPTVKAHLRAILRKTGVANRTQLALWLARQPGNAGLQPRTHHTASDAEGQRDHRPAQPISERTAAASASAEDDPARPTASDPSRAQARGRIPPHVKEPTPCDCLHILPS